MFGRRMNAALALAIGGCFSEPAYDDRICDLDRPCPPGYVCGLDRVCHPPGEVAASDAGGAADAGAIACEDESLIPANGWLLSYYRPAADGTIDRSTCLGTELVSSLAITFSSTASSALAPPLAIVGQSRRRFDGASSFAVAHRGALHLRANGVPLYDDFAVDADKSGIAIREYLHGEHSVVFDLIGGSGAASVSISWTNECATVAAPTDTTWRARYYRVGEGPSYDLDRSDCLGAETINSVTLAADWAESAPRLVRGLGITDRFGAEYSAPRTFAAATTVTMFHDDGLRVYANGALRYSDWDPSQTVMTTLGFTAGAWDIVLEYYENRGRAGIEFSW
jgi:hypothetical protein